MLIDPTFKFVDFLLNFLHKFLTSCKFSLHKPKIQFIGVQVQK